MLCCTSYLCVSLQVCASCAEETSDENKRIFTLHDNSESTRGVVHMCVVPVRLKSHSTTTRLKAQTGEVLQTVGYICDSSVQIVYTINRRLKARCAVETNDERDDELITRYYCRGDSLRPAGQLGGERRVSWDSRRAQNKTIKLWLIHCLAKCHSSCLEPFTGTLQAVALIDKTGTLAPCAPGTVALIDKTGTLAPLPYC